VTVNALLPNSSLLTVHGWGHVSLFLSACADATVPQYLIDGTTPAPGAICQQDLVPFGGSSFVTSALQHAALEQIPAFQLPAISHPDEQPTVREAALEMRRAARHVRGVPGVVTA
jgi:hypothetical protein